MFSFRKTKKIVNHLTEFINEDPENATVIEVLSNCDLCPSIEKEVPELLDFFCPPMPPSPNSIERTLNPSYQLIKERQKELSILALFPQDRYHEYDRYDTINKNAASIISSPA